MTPVHIPVGGTGMQVKMIDYAILDGGIVRVHFVSQAPFPYAQSDYYVDVTDAEVADTVPQVQITTLLTDRLNRKYGNVIANDQGGVTGQGISTLNTFKSAPEITIVT